MEGYWKLNRDLIVATLHYDRSKINMDYAVYITIHGDHKEIRDNFFIILYRDLIDQLRSEHEEEKLLKAIDLYYGFGYDMKRSQITSECVHSVEQLLLEHYGLNGDQPQTRSAFQGRAVNVRA
jgi:hypothetical protein